MDNMVSYIFDIRLVDIPIHIAYLGIILCVGYCISLVVIGFLLSIFKEIMKKEIPWEDKAIFYVAVCLDIVLILMFLYEKTT